MCELTIDQRHPDADALAAMVNEVHDAAAHIAVDERVAIDFERIWAIAPVAVRRPDLVALAEETAAEVTGGSARLFSGALHDAAAVASAGVPAVMLFVQSRRRHQPRARGGHRARAPRRGRADARAPRGPRYRAGGASAGVSARPPRSTSSKTCGGCGRENRKPWPWVAAEPLEPSRCCARSSMPSATVASPSACASDTIAPAIDAPWWSSLERRP